MIAATPHLAGPAGTAPPASTPIPSDVALRAVEWLVELQSGSVPDPVRQEWERWRAAHPDHARAWQRIEAVNGQLKSLSSPVQSAVTHATLTPRGSVRRRQAVTALAVMMFAGSTAWLVEDKTRWREWTADHRTGTGGRRTLVLDDGTQLVLNTDTAINVSFSASERRVRLLAGEILITTAKDPARRFLVETPDGEAQALGTRFLVRQQPGATRVSVFEGAVAIHPARTGRQALVLQAGEQTHFSATDAEPPLPADENSTAWTGGILVARGMRLADFLAELGRYSPHPLSCDPAVADVRVSGSYPVSDMDKVLDTLSATLSLQVETVTRFWGRQVVRVSLAPRHKNA